MNFLAAWRLSMLFLWRMILWIAASPFPSVSSSSSSSSSSFANYSPYHYDFTTPVFTPDGRLLQVEYAAKAADDYTSPLLAVRLNETTLALVAWTPAVTALQRLVVLPSSSSSSPPVLVAISGVLTDGMALLQKIQDHFRQQQLQLGGVTTTTTTTARSLALYAAQCCHERAMGGGIRPYGARCILLQQQTKQTQPTSDNDAVVVTAYITDPSGTMQAVDLNKNDAITILVGGGGNNARHAGLTRTLTKLVAKQRQVNTGGGTAFFLRKVLQECGHVLQQNSAAAGTDYRPQVVLWSTTTGEMYNVPAAQVDQLLLQR